MTRGRKPSYRFDYNTHTIAFDLRISEYVYMPKLVTSKPTPALLTPAQEAAPQMLAALRAVVNFLDGEPDAPEPFGMVRAALTEFDRLSNSSTHQ